MKRYLLFGALLFIGFAIAFLPASLASRAFEPVHGLDLLQPTGTLWHGSGQLVAEGRPLGSIAWRAQPLRLFQGAAAVNLDLDVRAQGTNPPGAVTGTAAYHLGGELEIDLKGNIDCASLEPVLAQYEIVMGGRLTSNNLVARVDPQRPWETLELDGQVDWSGGLVSYYLAGTLARQRLQPMRALLSHTEPTPRELQAQVYGQEEYPLMEFSLGASGFAKIGISKRLSQIVGSPWPGGDPDHAIILEVEQPLF